MRATLWLGLLAGAVAASAACAAASSSGRTSGGRDVITREEFGGLVEANAYDAIQRLRPWWLRAQRGGQEPVVYLDNVRYGELDALRMVALENLREIRFISSTDATTRWGTGHTGGVILLVQQR